MRRAGVMRAARGFTLIELMVVVALIAIAAGVASLALRDGSQVRLTREGERLAALLEGARVQARVGRLPASFAIGGTGVGQPTDFRFDGLAVPVDPRDLHWLHEGVVARIETRAASLYGPREEARIRLGPDPIIGAQRIVLQLDDRRVDIVTDGLGPFTVVAVDAP